MEKKHHIWKEFLAKELRKAKHILTFGTIGSVKIRRDIDVIITKKPNSKTASFYKEIHDVFDSLNNYLGKTHNIKAIRFSGFEPELSKLSNRSKKDISFHTMIYTSYSQIEKDWSWSFLEGEKTIKKTIEEDYDCIIGNKKDVFSKEFKKENKYDSVFIFINMYDRINSNYPEKLLVEVMNYYFDYLFRKKLKLKAPKAGNKKEVRIIFYKLCDRLDDLEKQK